MIILALEMKKCSFGLEYSCLSHKKTDLQIILILKNCVAFLLLVKIKNKFT